MRRRSETVCARSTVASRFIIGSRYVGVVGSPGVRMPTLMASSLHAMPLCRTCLPSTKFRIWAVNFPFRRAI
jgi:hypothetical protein